ncbi:MAG: tyrosine--tRNA ligase, partial [Pseudomonadota bacterium]|nr:tyrosine--tRNA ligase [Pseudomonadota bacterium]
ARKTFEEGAAAEGLPSVPVQLPMGVLQALVAAGLCSSNGDAKRNIAGGAVKVNDAAVSDDKLMLEVAMLNADGAIKLSLGKKKHVLLKQA